MSFSASACISSKDMFCRSTLDFTSSYNVSFEKVGTSSKKTSEDSLLLYIKDFKPSIPSISTSPVKKLPTLNS